MDKVGLGRALGYGARHAAKSVMQAVEAATAPNPNAPAKPGTAGTGPAAPGQAARPVRPEEVVRQVAQAHAQVQTHKKALKRSMMEPVKRFSSVLWLEVTGTFFALLAMGMGEGVWLERNAIHGPLGSVEAQKLYLSVVLFAVFGYFAISGFVRARRAGRR